MDKKQFLVLLDNGHGQETRGNMSPDLRIREYRYARDLVAEIHSMLAAEGYNVEIITPEENDVKLSERVNRANRHAYNVGVKNCLLVSVHLNAAGNGSEWCKAEGWQVCVGLNASSHAKELAGYLSDEAARFFKVRQPERFVKYWAQNLAICRDTAMPAVLTENLFMDSRADAERLQSREVFGKLVAVHCLAIKKYISNL